VAETVEALTHFGRIFEIIVVDDGNADNTFVNADKAVNLYAPNVRIIRHGHNRGFGAVFSTGMDAVKKDIVSFIAGDGQPSPANYYSQCLPPLDIHDMVVGKIRNRKDPELTLFFAWGERLLLSTLFPGVPKIEGPIMFRRSLLDKYDLHYRNQEDYGWIVIIELTIHVI
jgi:glycosyltransferase involved in cell wall biosynthesis